MGAFGAVGRKKFHRAVAPACRFWIQSREGVNYQPLGFNWLI